MRVHEPLPTRHIGLRVLRFDSVASTNDLATEAGVAVLAEVQTAGRGQHGRSWICPPGTSVQLSVALDPPVKLRRPVVLTAWAAVAIAETVRELTDIAPTIKWPNDVLVRGRKVAGILIEQKALVVAGIGLNVNQSAEQFNAAGLPDAGSLASITGRSFVRDEVARRLIAALDCGYGVLLDGKLVKLESQWVGHLGLLGRDVEVETIDGAVHRGRLNEMSFDVVIVATADPNSFAPEFVKQIRLM